jgi:hypothetical protein
MKLLSNHALANIYDLRSQIVKAGAVPHNMWTEDMIRCLYVIIGLLHDAVYFDESYLISKLAHLVTIAIQKIDLEDSGQIAVRPDGYNHQCDYVKQWLQKRDQLIDLCKEVFTRSANRPDEIPAIIDCVLPRIDELVRVATFSSVGFDGQWPVQKSNPYKALKSRYLTISEKQFSLNNVQNEVLVKPWSNNRSNCRVIFKMSPNLPQI